MIGRVKEALARLQQAKHGLSTWEDKRQQSSQSVADVIQAEEIGRCLIKSTSTCPRIYACRGKVIVGTAVFSQVEALEVDTPASASTNGPAGRSQTLEPKWFWGPLYSADLFIPVVGLQFAEGWTPRPLCREIYSVIHMVAGWHLIPLMVASLAGIAKSE
jgi:hypothetical protein